MKRYLKLVITFICYIVFFSEYILAIEGLEVAIGKSKKNKKKYGQSCTTIDLRNDVLGPPRNQDSMGWCSSFVAADLLSYKIGSKVSAFDVALSYNAKYKPQFEKKTGRHYPTSEQVGASVLNCVKASLEKGLCHEKDLPSEDAGFSDLRRALREIEGHKSFYEDFGLKALKSCLPLNIDLIKGMFPAININDFINIIEKSSEEFFLDKLADKACKKRLKRKDFTAGKYRATEKDYTSQEINKQLEQNNILGISYDMGLLLGNDEKLGHASVVVGRKFNQSTGECEYLIRNSWGRSCGFYEKRFECNQGNIYVPQSKLFEKIRYVYYLE